MNTILDFARAAAPWVAMGLTVAILAVRGAAKRKAKQPDGDYGTEGMCLGMCFGLLMGTALENNTGIALSLGMLAGLVIGTCIPKRTERAEK